MRGHSGGCFCGSIRFEVTGSPGFVCVCHCESCRRTTGGAMVAWATFSRSSVVVTKGKLAVLRSSPGVTRGFCADCGAHLTYSRDDRAAEVDVTLASLDDGTELRPTVHIWVAEKLPWVIISDGLPQYERRVPGALATNHVMPS